MTDTSKAAGRMEPEGMTRKAKFPRSYIKKALRIDIGDINQHLLFAKKESANVEVQHL